MKSSITLFFLCLWKLSVILACATKQQIQHGKQPFSDFLNNPVLYVLTNVFNNVLFFFFKGKCQTVPWSRLDEVFLETAEHGNLNWLQCLLKSGANINATSWDGYSAVIKASKEGDIDLIDFLIENGADINARTSHGFTPLLYAAKNSHHSIIELLVVNGADIEIKDKAGLTPLMHLARNGYIDMVSNCITQEGNDSNYTCQCSLPQVKDIICFLKILDP